MKKLVLLLMVGFMTFACSSSDDNKGGSDDKGTEVGISNSTKIKTPKWLQGEWIPKGAGEYNIQSFRIKPDDVCVVLGTSNCYQGMINEVYRVDPKQINVEQETKKGYYRLTMTFGGYTTTEFVFTQKGENEVDLQIEGLKATFVRK